MSPFLLSGQVPSFASSTGARRGGGLYPWRQSLAAVVPAGALLDVCTHRVSLASHSALVGELARASRPVFGVLFRCALLLCASSRHVSNWARFGLLSMLSSWRVAQAGRYFPLLGPQPSIAPCGRRDGFCRLVRFECLRGCSRGGRKGDIFPFEVAEPIGFAFHLGHLPRLIDWFRGGFFERHSFGVYLFHQQIDWMLLSIINVPGVPPVVIVAVLFVMSLAVSLAISVVLKRWKATSKLF